MSVPYFSLIIATCNRPEELGRLLQSLGEQTFKNFEVIVVDQSDPSFQDLVREAVGSAALPATYVLDVGKGLSRARNNGMRRAKGRVLAFPDDDCWYAPDLLERVAKVFERDPELVVLSGTYSEPGRWNPRFRRQPARLNLWNIFSCVSAVTVFVRHEAVRGIEFNENIGVGTNLPAGEEMEFVIRMLTRGYKGLYAPSMVVFHQVQRVSTTALDSVLRREQANAFVLLSNALRFKSPHLWLRFMGRLVKDLVRFARSTKGRRIAAARLEGYRMALKGRRDAG